MKKMTLSLSVLLALTLTGCAIPPKVIQLNSTITPQEMNALNERTGENLLLGSAFLKQNGGGVVTCAGNNVLLIPETTYTRDLIRATYGSTDKGLMNVYEGNIKVQPDLSDVMKKINKQTTCDAQGNFKFADVPDGNYFIVVPVTWKVVGYEGGMLMKNVTVKGGKEHEVIVSL